eukprot:CAMPEP_0174748508 /NCGR_PEP_ID=MMETSP1094-20130205/93659_1 /TAXON_ID=156173 /ORGANISM="Chrysochromulina brevifilum, Strain UTEX LB 985" /LENGTH=65 /DNA_ID=CAMNT_0015953561 /DNA_START=12 /DNA_END=205 /DNA_ORIENTATION=-
MAASFCDAGQEARPILIRPMSSIEIAAREAIAPLSLPDDLEVRDRTVSLLVDLTFVDGTASMARL